ncbi:MAG: hypothetical protein D3909_01185 [Candidatus Electrothrix sp. ATG1]|nr:hypothetical protein [Candidatus Electrothrix sp. ATG1]
MLLLATTRAQALPLLAALKEENVLLPIMAMDTGLGTAFSNYEQKEEKYPGYFSDGIYVPSVVFLDALSDKLALVRKDYELRKQGKRQERISNRAIRAVKAASLIKEALDRLRDTSGGMEAMRRRLQEEIKATDWFDGNLQGKANNLFIGVFDRQHLVTAPINPIIVEEGDVLFSSDKLLAIDGQKLYPTDIVYTGISMNELSGIDMDKLTYTMDFFLWFRYRNGVKGADDIEFLNALQPVKLSDAVQDTAWRKKEKIEAPEDTVSASLVRKVSFNGQDYRRYHVTGRFKTPNPKNYALGRQNLYVRFRNHTANRFRLSYVSDFAHNNKGIYSSKDAASMSDADIEGLKFDLIDASELTLSYAFSYISDSDRTMLGNPKGISESNDFSRFVAEYRVEPVLLSFRGIVSWVNETISDREDQIDLSLMILLLSGSCAFFLFSLYGEQTSLFKKHTSNSWWLLQMLMIFFILLFGELVVTQMIFSLKNLEWGQFHRDTIDALMRWTILTVEVLWWLIPAYYITSAFDQFLWQPLRRKTGAEVPNVLRLFVIVISYTLAVLGIMAYVLEVTPTSLAATSGVAAILFALASKIDLSNVMAGLGISISKVFKLGDWVKIDGVEGKVIEMTPRTTKVQTFDASVVNIPNSNVADAVVENFTSPDPVSRLAIHIETVPVYRFERVETVLLNAITSTEGVLDSPSPFVMFQGQGDSCQIFEVEFFINDYSKRPMVWQAAWRRIWRHLDQAGVQMAIPAERQIDYIDTDTKFSSPQNIINNCGSFSHLPEKEKRLMAKDAQFRRYPAGEIILCSGEADTALFIVVEGVISLAKEGQQHEQGKRLGVSEVFGDEDVSADTVVLARTDTEVLFVSKEDFLLATQEIS